jgi:hypothetical protein
MLPIGDELPQDIDRAADPLRGEASGAGEGILQLRAGNVALPHPPDKPPWEQRERPSQKLRHNAHELSLGLAHKL